ncbi:macro domain-containing protein [Jiangella endophytica]|uniref:macro domain-containing protein n=1 Tax=Jiangella endophytica TaxID=1623398 RepID=UPI000E34DC7E|nr:macro domain-containing protein [Jiangella endophytica]
MLRGDLLAADADALVDAVNIRGVMGEGRAAQFKAAHPAMVEAYAEAARAGELRPGRRHVWPTGASDGPRYIVNEPDGRSWGGKVRTRPPWQGSSPRTSG